MTTGEPTQKFASIYFRLPNANLVLQRRTNDAPHAAGKLGAFGGRVEDGETIDECLAREITEETSFAIAELTIKPTVTFIMPTDEYFDYYRQFYLYEASIQSLDFEVYEGVGAEAFSIEELLNRNDLNSSAEHAFKYLNLYQDFAK